MKSSAGVFEMIYGVSKLIGFFRKLIRGSRKVYILYVAVLIIANSVGVFKIGTIFRTFVRKRYYLP